MSRLPSLFMIAIGVLLAGCGSSTDSVATSGTPETATSTPAINEATPAPSASMLLAGIPVGITDAFEPPGDLDSVIANSALTAVTRLVGYELNPVAQPAGSLPDIYVPGYAGPRGVLRLVFDVEEVVGGRDADQAIGVEGDGKIAVDLEHWLAPDQQKTQNGALDGLVERPERYVLVLRDGEIDGVRTGAYRLWVGPNVMGLYREGWPGGGLQKVHPDHDLVLQEAIERGATVTTTAPHPTDDAAAVGPSGESEPRSPGSPEPFASGEGMSVESFLARYQTT